MRVDIYSFFIRQRLWYLMIVINQHLVILNVIDTKYREGASLLSVVSASSCPLAGAWYIFAVFSIVPERCRTLPKKKKKVLLHALTFVRKANQVVMDVAEVD